MPSKCQTPPQKSPSIIEHILRIWNRIQMVWPMNQRPRGIIFEKKNKGRKSRDTVPLSIWWKTLWP
jgi:hypothetical protein